MDLEVEGIDSVLGFYGDSGRALLDAEVVQVGGGELAVLVNRPAQPDP